MLTIQHVAHDTYEFSAVIRRLINAVATLQYNESIDEGGGDKTRVDHYAMMMYDLRELDQLGTRVKLGLVQTTDNMGRIAEQLIMLAGIDRPRDTEETFAKANASYAHDTGAVPYPEE